MFIFYFNGFGLRGTAPLCCVREIPLNRSKKVDECWLECGMISVFRQKGVSGRCQGAELFQQRCYGSLHSVQRLELMYKLEAHHGCVNALHFNSSGTLLASGSDDLSIVVWDWALGKFLVFYDSGHRSNVFQVSLWHALFMLLV